MSRKRRCSSSLDEPDNNSDRDLSEDSLKNISEQEIIGQEDSILEMNPGTKYFSFSTKHDYLSECGKTDESSQKGHI